MLTILGGDASMPRPISEEFAIDETTIDNKIIKLYRWYAVYYDFGSEKTEENKEYRDSRFWIDDRGYEIKSVTIKGNLKSKTVISHRIHEYEYNPKDLVIKAPKIKKTSKSK